MSEQLQLFGGAPQVEGGGKTSDEWYTPPFIVDLCREVLGELDLDPCSNDRKTVEAKQHFTKQENGLSKQWHGNVFMNPPFSAGGEWTQKLEREYQSGRCTGAIALVLPSIDTLWMQPLLQKYPICFWSGRIHFMDSGYKYRKSGFTRGTAFVYFGENIESFASVFNEHGTVMKKIN